MATRREDHPGPKPAAQTPHAAFAETDGPAPASVVAALSVYVEPLAADARVAVLGDAELGFHDRLLELGVRTVHLFDPDASRVARLVDEVPRGVSVRLLRDDFDVRDAAFDLVIIPDVGLLPDAAALSSRLRRILDPRGTVIGMGRARTEGSDPSLFPELASASLEYAELYDLFALQFENVTMTGVLPFTGVVFAELGAGDDLTVSVDTRLVDPEPPGVFVVIASRDEDPVLDPYAIVQITRPSLQLAPTQIVHAIPTRVGAHPHGAREARDSRERDEAEAETQAAFATAQLRAQLLAQQLDDQRVRLASAEQRASELEDLVADAQDVIGGLEARLVNAEQAVVERDLRLAAVDAAAIAADEAVITTELVDPAVIAGLVLRAEAAEAQLAIGIEQLALMAEQHGVDTSNAEAQLRERASVVAAMQQELDRREALVRELVASLDEVRSSGQDPHVFEAAPVMPGASPEDLARLRRKLDELALEVAKREGELTAQAWRIDELENDKRTLAADLLRARSQSANETLPPSTQQPTGSERVDGADATRELARARDELDALRQALAQEHAARVAAESGEELAKARAELARQMVLLDQAEHEKGTKPAGA